MDNDEAGQLAVENFVKKLGGKRTLVVDMNVPGVDYYKDANEAYNNGVDLNTYIKHSKSKDEAVLLSVEDLAAQTINRYTNFDKI